MIKSILLGLAWKALEAITAFLAGVLAFLVFIFILILGSTYNQILQSIEAVFKVSVP